MEVRVSSNRGRAGKQRVVSRCFAPAKAPDNFDSPGLPAWLSESTVRPEIIVKSDVRTNEPGPLTPAAPNGGEWKPRELPWRSVVGSWPLALRQRWGDLANELMEAGMPWPEDEAEAFRRVCDEATPEELP